MSKTYVAFYESYNRQNTKSTAIIVFQNKTATIAFYETVLILSRNFSEKSSLFYPLYQCLMLMEKANNDYVIYAGIVNRGCEIFKLNVLTSVNFKCLIFVYGLTAERDSKILSGILSKL